MTNHDLLLLTLGSLSGAGLSSFCFYLFHTVKVQGLLDLHASNIAKARNDLWSSGYEAAHKNIVGGLNVTKP